MLGIQIKTETTLARSPEQHTLSLACSLVSLLQGSPSHCVLELLVGRQLLNQSQALGVHS